MRRLYERAAAIEALSLEDAREACARVLDDTAVADVCLAGPSDRSYEMLPSSTQEFFRTYEWVSLSGSGELLIAQFCVRPFSTVPGSWVIGWNISGGALYQFPGDHHVWLDPDSWSDPPIEEAEGASIYHYLLLLVELDLENR